MTWPLFFEALVLAASLSLDALAASFAYGSAKIKIPFLSVLIISGVCSGIVGISLLVGTAVRPCLPAHLAAVICFAVLFVLGILKLLDSATKAIIRRHSDISRELRFKLFNFRFILRLYANPTEADVDSSRSISPGEAASLAFALSLDGLAVGFGAAVGAVSGWVVFTGSLVTNIAAVLLGCWTGNRVAWKSASNLAWVSGVVLVALGVSKLI